MPSTTHPEFNANTEALDVAKAFPDAIRGKTIVVTGCNRGGIGYTTAEALASQSPANLVVVGRNPAKMQEAIGELQRAYPDVRYHTLQMDLGSQKSVRAGAAELLGREEIPAIDLLINSAGVIVGGETPSFSEDDIETHMATNHIGHFLFTCLVMPKLIAAATAPGAVRGAVRVVNVSSRSPTMARMRWSDLRFQQRNRDLPAAEQPDYGMHQMWGWAGSEDMAYVPIEAYSQSKVANVLFGIGMTKRLFARYGILGVALHPGIIITELGRNLGAETKMIISAYAEQSGLGKTLGAGSSTTLVAALDPGLAQGPGSEAREGRENYGAFLSDCQISSEAQPLAVSSAEAEKLWALSEELVGQNFSW